MDVSIFLAAFCVTLSSMLAHCASDAVPQQISDHLHLHLHLHLQQFDHRSKFRFSVPRKLKFEEQLTNLKSLGDNEIVSHKKHLLEASSGQQINKVHAKQENVMMHARKGTWREWVEDPNKSEYFTMDYHWVRRRRPVHNKQIPFVP